MLCIEHYGLGKVFYQELLKNEISARKKMVVTLKIQRIMT